MIEARSMMQRCQHDNMKNGGISFTEEGFTQLYEECLNDLIVVGRKSSLSGAIIGGSIVGLIGLGIYGVNKIRKNISKDEKR